MKTVPPIEIYLLTYLNEKYIKSHSTIYTKKYLKKYPNLSNNDSIYAFIL